MFDARNALTLLVESPALDSLIEQARAQTQKLAAHSPTSVMAELNDFDEQAARLADEAKAASLLLQEALEQKHASRQMKVATVLRILKVASRLVG